MDNYAPSVDVIGAEGEQDALNYFLPESDRDNQQVTTLPTETTRIVSKGRFVHRGALSFASGVLVGALIVPAFASRRPYRSTSIVRLTTASSSSVGPVAMTSVAEPREVEPASPTPRDSPDSESVAPRSYRGGLRITSQPIGATVFVNNQHVGQTPIALSSLPVGSRAIRVELDGYAPWSRAVSIVANQAATVSARLEASPR